MSRIAISAVEFRDNVSVPGFDLDQGDLSTHLEHGPHFDLSFDPVLGCIYATRIAPAGIQRKPQTRLYPVAGVSSMIYAADQTPPKR